MRFHIPQMHLISKQHNQVGIKCSDMWSYGGNFHSNHTTTVSPSWNLVNYFFDLLFVPILHKQMLILFFPGKAILQNLWDYLSQTTVRTLLNIEDSSFPYKTFQLSNDEVEPWDLYFKQVVPEDFHGCLEYMQESLVIKLPYSCNAYSQTK